MRQVRKLLFIALLLAASLAVAATEAEAPGEPHFNVELWKTLNFVLLAAGLVWLIRKFLLPYFSQRTQQIQDGIAEARKLKESAEARAAEMERRLAGLEHQIAEMRDKARAEMAAEEARIQRETEWAAARLEANAKGEIASAVTQARRQLRAFATELAVDLARRKVEEQMTPQIQARLVDALAGSLKPKSGRQD